MKERRKGGSEEGRKGGREEDYEIMSGSDKLREELSSRVR